MCSYTNKDFDSAFDCSCYLAHGIQLPYHSEGHNFRLHPREMMASAIDQVIDAGQQAYNFSAAKLKQLELAEPTGRSTIEDYYPVEYNNFLSLVNHSDLDDFTMTGNEFNLIREISAAQDALEPTSKLIYDKCNTERIKQLIYCSENLSLQEMFWKNMRENEQLMKLLLNKKELKDNRSKQCSLKYENMIRECMQEFGENPRDSWNTDDSNSSENYTRKRRLCKHFLKGYCKRGRACDFLHDLSMFYPTSQKVFLGGLPTHITEFTLRLKLAQQGYKVINRPKVLRGFSPQVCMGSEEEAQELIAKGSILIDDSFVDVRAYGDYTTCDIEKMRPEYMKRSVFLGGLAKGTTSQMIRDDLKKMDVKVVNNPLIKNGFTPKVTLATIKERNMLIKLKRVSINNTLVDVRPYISLKNPSRSNRKRK